MPVATIYRKRTVKAAENTKVGTEPGIYRRPPKTAAFTPSPPLPAPSSADLEAARKLVGHVLPPTPMVYSPRLSRRWSRTVHVKYENVSPVRSFKARGAINAIGRISGKQPPLGVVTASTGNHGQGVAYAGKHFGVPVTVVAPEGAETAKLDAIRDIGPDLEVFGRNLTEAQSHAHQLATARGALFIEDGEDADLMAGAASVAWEMLKSEPTLDCLMVPVGGGNLVASTLLAVSHLKPDVTVVGVQSSAAPGATLSWINGAMVKAACRTFAGGLATEHPGARSLAVMTELLDYMVVVSDDDLWSGIATVFDTTGAAVEGAAAASVAALDQFNDDIPGDHIGLMLTGGWISREDLVRALTQASA